MSDLESILVSMNCDDLAWVAGYLEGEGFFFIQTSAKGYIRVGIGACSCDKDVLERLHVLVSRSRLQGPYLHSTNFGSKPHWRWVLQIREDTIELARELRPLMGARRQEQIDRLLEHHERHPKIRRRATQMAHGTRTLFGRGCRCYPCRSAENRYQRERRAIRKAKAAA
jgi:hypothetical protein